MRLLALTAFAAVVALSTITATAAENLYDDCQSQCALVYCPNITCRSGGAAAGADRCAACKMAYSACQKAGSRQN